jgi:GT2 family glycosyltransferase
MTHLAVIIASHNRREALTRCLHALERSAGRAGVNTSVFILDAGSSDGTRTHIELAFPAVFVVTGNRYHYWATSVRFLIELATARCPEAAAILHLNDDVELVPDAVGSLLAAAGELDGMFALVGAVVVKDDPTRLVSSAYRFGRLLRIKYKKIPVRQQVQRCDTVSGNILLLSRDAAQLASTTSFTHGFLDLVLGARVTRAGGVALQMPGHLGVCVEPNAYLAMALALAADSRLPWYRLLFHPKSPPLREVFEYSREIGGILWPIGAIAWYRLALITLGGRLLAGTTSRLRRIVRRF